MSYFPQVTTRWKTRALIGALDLSDSLYIAPCFSQPVLSLTPVLSALQCCMFVCKLPSCSKCNVETMY